MVDWETHLETLLEWEQQGRVRYIGITTSQGRRLALLVRMEPVVGVGRHHALLY